MKKLVFALIGALAMASIPLNVNAADECVIRVNSGETKTINYNANGCRVENYGTLNVVNGANISKYTQNSYAAIDNYGTLNVSGGTIYADYGYTIMNHAGNVNISGGTIHSILHQAVWSKAGTNTKVTGGTLKGAIGGEEVVYSNGNLTICGGNFNGPRSNRGTAAETANCPKPAEPAKTNTEPEKHTITVTVSVKKNETTNAAATKAVATTTKATNKTVATQTQATTTTQKAEDKPAEKKEATPKKTETEKTEKDNDDKQTEDNNLFVFAIAAIITVFGTATAAIVTSRIRH